MDIRNLQRSLQKSPQSATPLGKDGYEVELRSDGSYVQWRYKGFAKWLNIVSLADLTGPQGDKGLKGDKGDTGSKGDQGIQGIQGLQGEKGDTGEQGIEGKQGEVGARGFTGLEGKPGVDGSDGKNGKDAREIELRKTATYIQWRWVGGSVWNNIVRLDELKGEPGAKGDKGDKGAKGDRGIPGEAGERGDRGPIGYTGARGLQGEQGIQGVKGDKGDPGSGGGGGSDVVANEVPAGAVNGINKIFTTAFDFVSDGVSLYINGLRQTMTLHYTETGDNQITLDEAPHSSDIITVDYIKAQV